MANESVDAVATVADIRPFPGDSFSDQVLGYTATTSTPSKPAIGLPVGCAIVGAFLLAVTATLSVYTHRQRKQNRVHKVRSFVMVFDLCLAVCCIGYILHCHNVLPKYGAV